MNRREASRSQHLSRVVLVLALVSSVALFGACSSSKGTKTQAKPPVTTPARSKLVLWRQCLVRHGGKRGKAAPVSAKAQLKRQQLVKALQKSKALRLKVAAQLLKAPPGVEKT